MNRTDFRLCSIGVFLGLATGLLAGCQVARPHAGMSELARGQAAFAACVAEQCDRLDLDRARLSDYRFLGDLTHVSALMISWTDFSDMADIAGMTQLTELHIGGTEVTDISGIGTFENLRVLHIQSARVADFAPVGGLQGLEELAISGRPGELAVVAEMHRLQRLSLQISRNDLSALDGHPGLRSVDVPVERETDLSVFATMPGLRQLNLTTFSDLSEAQSAQVEALRAAGIEVNEDFVAVIVC